MPTPRCDNVYVRTVWGFGLTILRCPCSCRVALCRAEFGGGAARRRAVPLAGPTRLTIVRRSDGLAEAAVCALGRPFVDARRGRGGAGSSCTYDARGHALRAAAAVPAQRCRRASRARRVQRYMPAGPGPLEPELPARQHPLGRRLLRPAAVPRLPLSAAPPSRACPRPVTNGGPWGAAARVRPESSHSLLLPFRRLRHLRPHVGAAAAGGAGTHGRLRAHAARDTKVQPPPPAVPAHTAALPASAWPCAAECRRDPNGHPSNFKAAAKAFIPPL